VKGRRVVREGREVKGRRAEGEGKGGKRLWTLTMLETD